MHKCLCLHASHSPIAQFSNHPSTRRHGIVTTHVSIETDQACGVFWIGEFIASNITTWWFVGPILQHGWKIEHLHVHGNVSARDMPYKCVIGMNSWDLQGALADYIERFTELPGCTGPAPAEVVGISRLAAIIDFLDIRCRFRWWKLITAAVLWNQTILIPSGNLT